MGDYGKGKEIGVAEMGREVDDEWGEKQTIRMRGMGEVT